MRIKKKETVEQQKVIDESQAIVRDFRIRLPFGDYRVMPYEIYAPFRDFKREADEYLIGFFSGEVDDANANLLDNMINDMAQKAFADLDNQKTTHADRYKALAAVRPSGDRKQYEEELVLLSNDLGVIEESLQEIRERYREEKFEKQREKGSERRRK